MANFSDYQGYLQYAGNSGDIADSGSWIDPSGAGLSNMWTVNNDWLANPTSLFDAGYNTGGRRSVNPYFTTQNRDALRNVASRLGLNAHDADIAALDYATSQYWKTGQGYTDASSPTIIANEVAKRLFAQAGHPYQGLTPEQYTQYSDRAAAVQNFNKQYDEDAWKRDDIGGALAFMPEVAQYNWEQAINDPQRLLLGAETPLGTGVWNKALNKDWDPVVNEVGGPTGGAYEQAANQGIETGGAQAIQWLLDNTAKVIGTSAANEAIGGGMADSGIDPAYAPAVTGAAKGAAGAIANPNGDFTDVLDAALKGAALSGSAGDESLGGVAADAYKLSKAYENDNYGALAGGVGSAAGNVGNLYASADTGTLTDAAPAGTSAGTTGGGMWDEQGNWIDSSGGGYNDPYAGAYNDPQYEGGYDTSGQYDPWAGVDPYSGVGDTGSGSLGSLFSGGLNSLGSLFSGAGGSLAGLLGGGGTNTGTGAGGGTSLGNLLGILGSSGLGAMGATNLANKYDAMSKRYEGFGAPYREQLSNLYANPNSFLQSNEVQTPVQMGTDALMRSLSTKGNPFGSGTALQTGQDYAANQLFSRLGEEKNRLGGFGGLTAFSQAAPGAASKAADAGAGVYNAAGYGLGQALNPPKTLAQQLGLV